ncbi:hypothetical protein Tco_0498083, partial [Tanacetum coccineum]
FGGVTATAESFGTLSAPVDTAVAATTSTRPAVGSRLTLHNTNQSRIKN